jgi:ketosteroid isomerase-like protein
MSQENVEIVRREYGAFAARDWAALADLCHPDIEYETLQSAPGFSGTYHGLDEITEFFDAWAEPYSEFRVEPDEIIDAGDHVVTVERHAVRGLKGSDSAEISIGRLRRPTRTSRRIGRTRSLPTAAFIEDASRPEDSSQPSSKRGMSSTGTPKRSSRWTRLYQSKTDALEAVGLSE